MKIHQLDEEKNEVISVSVIEYEQERYTHRDIIQHSAIDKYLSLCNQDSAAAEKAFFNEHKKLL